MKHLEKLMASATAPDDREKQTAFEMANNGAGTATSKILMLVGIHIQIAIGILLLKNQGITDVHYLGWIYLIPLFFSFLFPYVNLPFPFIGFFLQIGLFIYFIYLQNWLIVGLVFATFVLSNIARSISVKYLLSFENYRRSRKIYTGEVNRNPLEGMPNPEITMGIIVLFSFALYFEGTISQTFWVFYSIALFLYLSAVWRRVKANWCRIYYPLKYRFSVFHLVEIKKRKGEPDSTKINKAIISMIKSCPSRRRKISVNCPRKYEKFLNQREIN